MQENLCYLDWKFNKSMLKYLIFFKNQNPYHPICFFKTHFNFSHCSWQSSKILILYTCIFKSNYQLIFFSRLPKSQFAGLCHRPTIDQPSTNHRPFINQLSTDHQPTIDRPSTDHQLTIDWHLIIDLTEEGRTTNLWFLVL